jgi:hypothetical protein
MYREVSNLKKKLKEAKTTGKYVTEREYNNIVSIYFLELRSKVPASITNMQAKALAYNMPSYI